MEKCGGDKYKRARQLIRKTRNIEDLIKIIVQVEAMIKASSVQPGQ